jgi:hypothetical protein
VGDGRVHNDWLWTRVVLRREDCHFDSTFLLSWNVLTVGVGACAESQMLAAMSDVLYNYLACPSFLHYNRRDRRCYMDAR